MLAVLDRYGGQHCCRGLAVFSSTRIFSSPATFCSQPAASARLVPAALQRSATSADRSSSVALRSMGLTSFVKFYFCTVVLLYQRNAGPILQDRLQLCKDLIIDLLHRAHRLCSVDIDGTLDTVPAEGAGAILGGSAAAGQILGTRFEYRACFHHRGNAR